MMSLQLRQAQAGWSLSVLTLELEDTKNSCKIIIVAILYHHHMKKKSTELT